MHETPKKGFLMSDVKKLGICFNGNFSVQQSDGIYSFTRQSFVTQMTASEYSFFIIPIDFPLNIPHERRQKHLGC